MFIISSELSQCPGTITCEPVCILNTTECPEDLNCNGAVVCPDGTCADFEDDCDYMYAYKDPCWCGDHNKRCARFDAVEDQCYEAYEELYSANNYCKEDYEESIEQVPTGKLIIFLDVCYLSFLLISNKILLFFLSFFF